MRNALKGMFHFGRLIMLTIHQDREGKVMLSSCELVRSGDKITVSKYSEFKNILHFSKQYESGMAVILNLSGKGILEKEVSGNSLSAIDAFRLALPNSKAEDFYIQKLSGEESLKIVMVRRETADFYLNELSGPGLVVVSLCLNLKESEFKKAGINLILGLENLGVDLSVLKDNLEQLQARTKLKRISILSAFSMFMALLVNFFCYSTYSNKVTALEKKHNVTQDKVDRYQMIEADVSEKIQLIKTTGWAGGYPLAWLTDRVMASKPSSIEMSEFVINPINERILDEKSKSQENLKILVRGSSNDAVELNGWLHQIRSMNWVRNCDLVSYNFNKESGKGEFMLALNIADAKQ
jgi:hypothetical protein